MMPPRKPYGNLDSSGLSAAASRPWPGTRVVPFGFRREEALTYILVAQADTSSWHCGEDWECG